MIFMGNIEALIDFFSFIVWIFYVLAMVVLLMLRKLKPDAPRPYKVTEKRNMVCSFMELLILFKVPIIVPIIVIIVGSYLVVAPLVTNPAIEYCYIAAILFVGFVVYVPFVYYKLSMACLGNEICFCFCTS
jgi:solute carrier family 7 (L-type amino acid transporter), member 9/15